MEHVRTYRDILLDTTDALQNLRRPSIEHHPHAYHVLYSHPPHFSLGISYHATDHSRHVPWLRADDGHSPAALSPKYEGGKFRGHLSSPFHSAQRQHLHGDLLNRATRSLANLWFHYRLCGGYKSTHCHTSTGVSASPVFVEEPDLLQEIQG